MVTVGIPGTTGSGSSMNTRICKKLVVKGHASSSGATYTLFLKIQLPATERGETHVLIEDSAAELQEAIVHLLDASGAAPTLSASAATAASALRIPLSIRHDLNESLIEYELRERGNAGSSSSSSEPSDLPTVARSDDGKITFRTTNRSSPRSKHKSASHPTSSSYMVTLHLYTKPLSTPPTAPFSVKLAVPVCLNNYLRFTVDESIDSDFGLHGMAVEVDPPILPIPSQRRPLRRRSSTASSRRPSSIVSHSDDEADLTLLGSDSGDEADPEHDNTAIVGPFHACKALILRMASQQAGDFVICHHPLYLLPNALRAEQGQSWIRYQLFRKAGDDSSDNAALRAYFVAKLKLDKPYFPGLDREVQLYIQLGSDLSILEWRPVKVDASRGILSWSFGSLASLSPLKSQQPNGAVDTNGDRVSGFEIGDLVVLPEPSQQAADEEDLLNVAPPKGIDNINLDFSVDNGAAPSAKKRRFSLQSSSSTRHLPSTPPSEQSESALGNNNVLAITLNLLPVLQGSEPLSVSVLGTLMLTPALSKAIRSRDFSDLPRGLSAPAVANLTKGPFDVALVDAKQDQWPDAAKPNESLVDSRETVQKSQQEGKTGLVLHGTSATNAGEAEEILQKALAIIAAHNEILSKADRGANSLTKHTEHSKQGRQESGSGWVLHVSHLLWTLFLTAMILMLFNAGQTAHRTLSAKLDELSRLLQVPPRADVQSFVGVVQHTRPEPAVFEPASTAASASASALASEPQRSEAFGVHELDDAEMLTSASTPSWPDHAAEPLSDGPHTTASLDTALQMRTLHTSLSSLASTWIHDMLRIPLSIIHRLWSILVRA